MFNKSVLAGFNDQITKEFYSAFVYLSMAAHFEEMNLPGFAHWMRLQYHEELGHGNRLFDLVLNGGGKVELEAIDKPPSGFGGALSVMKKALAHEQSVTKSINDLYELTLKEKNYPAQLEIQWFIGEQAEEEKTVTDIVAQLEMVGDNKPALLVLDHQMAGRSATE
ncbi:MAG: ferritin [Gemmatimonadetes bacterium]|nr:ferritin [Gemmatimonadota bacterium]